MNDPTLTGQAEPTTASLVQGECTGISSVCEKIEAEFHSLHMTWTLITGANGNWLAQMQWAVIQ
jgi:hypothetical protein